MKKYIYSILAPLVLFSAKISQAQTPTSESPIEKPEDILRVLSKVVQYAYRIFFIVAIIYIIIAAFNFLTAKGDPTKIQSARSQITWAVVAIIIALISVGAAEIIRSFLAK